MRQRIITFLVAVTALASCSNNTYVVVTTDVLPHPKQDSFAEFCEKVQQKWDKKEEVGRIYICAHRGNTKASYEQGIPDNSIPNIIKAMELGADMVELDVRMTKDGVPVLMHNPTINETTEGTGAVTDLTLAQIQSYRMKKGGKVYRDTKGEYTYVPTLKEALEQTKDRIYVNLDLASKNCDARKIMSVIMEVGVEDQVVLYGVDAAEYSSIYPFVGLHPYIREPKDVTKYQNYSGAKLFQYSNGIYLGNTIPQFGTQVHLFGGLTFSNLLDNYDKAIRDNDDYSALDKFIISGSDFVQTDYLELVDSYLKKQGYR